MADDPPSALPPTLVIGTPKFTPKQGLYLAFIHHYSLLHHEPPAEADIQRYFGTSSAAVHQMVLALERRGLISRTPGHAHSISVHMPPGELPHLDPSLSEVQAR